MGCGNAESISGKYKTMINFSDDTPDWIKDWVTWATSLLIPEWDVSVNMVDDFKEDANDTTIWNNDGDLSSDRDGEILCSSENLTAHVKLKKCIEDTTKGHIGVVHEICHAVTCRMSESAKNLISSKVVRKTAWKSYDAAEEETVVRLSRSLVQLREGRINGTT